MNDIRVKAEGVPVVLLFEEEIILTLGKEYCHNRGERGDRILATFTQS